MITRRLLALAQTMLSLASVLISIRNLFHIPADARHQEELHRLRAENLRLRNEKEYIRQGVESNRVVEGDLKIEILKYKIAAEKRAAGIRPDDYTQKG